MTELLVGVLIAATVLGFIVKQWLTTQYAKDYVYTSDRRKAHYGKGFGPVDSGLNNTIRERIFKRDGNVCQITNREGIRGQPDNGIEYFRVGLGELTNGFIGDAELEIGHFPIPHALGGRTVDENLIVMIKGLNRKLSNSVTPEMEKWCRKHGKKIWRKGIQRTTISEILKKNRARI